MNKVYVSAAALVFGALLSDYGLAMSTARRTVDLAESSGPTSGGHDTALHAESESSGPSPNGHDSALA
ncbi:MAG: hypothetical protein RQ966_11195 [Acetobacteraceae bacterium]|nr:hypothetical protein [Acetobacteraceae bacterium]